LCQSGAVAAMDGRLAGAGAGQPGMALRVPGCHRLAAHPESHWRAIPAGTASQRFAWPGLLAAPDGGLCAAAGRWPLYGQLGSGAGSAGEGVVTGFFVTGTDTGVGKTVVACALLQAFAAAGWRTQAIKPVAAGCERTAQGLRNADALALQAAMNTA